MPQGTITLPSGDKLVTQVETLQSGALVHREEVVISGTVSGRHALPTNFIASTSDFGVPVRVINDQIFDVNLRNVGVSGTPLRIDPTGNTTQPVSFSSPQPISTIAGTVQVAFIPASSQSVTIVTPSAGGTVLALYSEQQSQTAQLQAHTTSLQLIDDIVHSFNAAIGKSALISGQRDDEGTVLANEDAIAPVRITSRRAGHVSLRNESGHEIGVAGTPLRIDPTGTTTQPVSISSPIDIGNVAGTVNVAFAPVSTQNVTITTPSAAGTVLALYSEQLTQTSTLGNINTGVGNVRSAVLGTIGVNINAMPAVSISGSISIPDYARFSEQITQTSKLTTLDTDLVSIYGAVLGTPAVKFASAQSVNIANTPSINFSGQQPIIGTIQSLPPITFASTQSVSVSGTISLPDYARYSEQQTQTSRLSTIDTDILSVFNAIIGTPAIKFPSAQSVNIANTPAVTFDSPQPISTIAGTVQVAFTPASSQNVTISTPAAAGTVLSLYSEQLIQTTRLNSIDTDVIAVRNAVLGTIGVNINALPSVTFTSPQPISSVAGTVQVAFTPSSTQSVNLRNAAGFEVATVGTPIYTAYSSPPTIAGIANPVNIGAVAGTVQVAFTPSSVQSVNVISPAAGGTVLALLSEQQTQTTALNAIDSDIISTRNAILGTIGVNINTMPTVSLAGTISIADYARYSEQVTQTTSLNLIDDVIHAFNSAIGKIALVGGQRDDASTTLGTEDNISPFRITSRRALHTSLRREDGNEFATAGTPLYVELTGGVTQPVSFSGQQPIHGTVVVSSLPSVSVNSLPTISFSSPQPISTVSGTVSVIFPSAQSVNVSTLPNISFTGQQPIIGTIQSLPPVTFASPQQVTFSGQQPIHGTVIVGGLPAITIAASQTVGISGTISAPDYARYSEQLTQTSNLSTIDSDIIAVRNAIIGTPAVKFPNTQPVNITNIPAVTFDSPQNVNMVNVGFAGTPLRIDPTGTTTQPVSLAGTISLADYARYSEQQTQTISLQLLDDFVHAFNAAINKVALTGGQKDDQAIALATEDNVAPFRITSARALHSSLRREDGRETGTAGTPLFIELTGGVTQPVSVATLPSISFVGQQPIIGTIQSLPPITFASPQQVTFSGQQPVHGTVIVNSIPAITIAPSQFVGISGTISIADYARFSEQQTQTNSLGLIDDIVHAFNGAIGKGALVSGQRDDSTITLATEDNIAPVRITTYRAQHVSLRNEIGNEIGTSGTPLFVRTDTSVTQPVSLASLPNISFSGQQPIIGTIQSIPAITIAASQNVGISGTISLPDYSRYSEQLTQTTSLQLIDDVVHTFNATIGKTGLAGGQKDDQSTTLATEDNIAPFRITAQRAQHISLRREDGREYGTSGTPIFIEVTGNVTQPVSFPSPQAISTIAGTVAVNTQTNIRSFKTGRIDVGASGNTTIVNSVTAKRLKVYAINMSAERAGTIQAVWMDGTSSLSGTQMFLDREGFTQAVTPPAFLFAPQAGTGIVFHASANQFAFGMRGILSYWDDDNI